MKSAKQIKADYGNNGHRYNLKAGGSFGVSKLKKCAGLWIGDLTLDHLNSVLDKYERERKQATKMVNVTGWYTVNISNCKELSNSSIVSALKYAMLPLNVPLFDFKRSDDGSGGQFHVDNTLVANRLKRLNGKVSVLFGSQKIYINVETGLLPNLLTQSHFTPELLTVIKAALWARYDAKSQTLNLSRFHAAPELIDQLCALHAVPILQRILQMISQEFPHLRVLQLRNNFLCTFRSFDDHARPNMPELQTLDVGVNRIQDIIELKILKNMHIQTLDISCNPVAKCQLWRLCAMLPQVHIKGCSSTQKFEEPQRDPFLVSERFYRTNSESVEFCTGFAKLYFDIFDKRSLRPELKNLNAAKAMFSLCVPEQLLHSTNCSRSYLLYNRNQLHLHSSFARSGKLRFGLQAVIETIVQFPEMQTFIENAQLDILTYDNRFRIFTLGGSCLERTSDASWIWRNFSRQIVMRPMFNDKWMVTNDIMTITLNVKRQDSFQQNLAHQPVVSISPYVKSRSIKNQLAELSNYMPKLVLELITSDQGLPPMIRYCSQTTI